MGNQRILIPESHILRGRTQGCWNCKHATSGKVLWNQRRHASLERAIELSQSSPLGENDQRVFNIRGMVNKMDHAIASRAQLHCTGGGVTGIGVPVGEFVAHNYLCEKWSGAEGSSLARDVGKTDKLPEEAAEDIEAKIPTLDELLIK